MGWFSRTFGRSRRRNEVAPVASEKRAHLEQFVATRKDVEAFMEPSTTLNPLSLVLVAADGEWTRRQVPSEAAARKFAKDVNIPIYDVNQSGYPSAMREFNARRRNK